MAIDLYGEPRRLTAELDERGIEHTLVIWVLVRHPTPRVYQRATDPDRFSELDGES